MTRSTIEIRTTAEDHRIAHMAACAIGLSLIEAAIPSPLPGVKPGLANIVTLIVLLRYGLKTAAWVSLLRVVAGSLLLGTFLSPSFVLSLSGAAASLLVLALAVRLPSAYFGAPALSMLASFAHIGAQLGVAYLWLIPHAGLVYLLPLFGCAALVFGAANGLIAAKLLAGEQAGGAAAVQT